MNKRKKFLILQWSLTFLLIASIALGILTELTAFAVISISLFVVIVISAIFGRLAFAAKFKHGNIWVSGAGKEFLSSLPEYAVR